MYKLYRSGTSRFLDFLGLRIGKAEHYFQEHWALKNLTFDVPRGSTIGIIGRNGAGKSTLLRLLAGASAPTRGEIVTDGRISALLELGTGFHPDLTGHDNIFAIGLYLGLDRRAMTSLYDDIVAFAELGDFLYQPVRTYSVGMQMRLAFSVAAYVPADIQIVDEVLGVGDAYFFGKCLQRFRRLQEEGRTTVLVSHDLGTVLRLCSRCLWIDRGMVVADGSALEVIHAYNQSIYEERDRATEAGCTAAGLNLGPARVLRVSKSVWVEDIQFLTVRGVSKHVFATGEMMVLRIQYHSRVKLPDAVVAVVVYRADGVTVCNAISSLDGAKLEIHEGEGTIELVFDRLLLGPGEYTVAIGIYPSLDLSDPANMQHAVIWHKPLTFVVSRPSGVMVDLGVLRHPVRWRSSDPSTVAVTPVGYESGLS